MTTLNSQTANHLLRQLPYENWLTIGILHSPKGMGRVKVGSLDELLWTLRPSLKSLATVNFDTLENWLRDSVEDNFFAQEVYEINAKEIAYVEKSKQVFELTEQRVIELKNTIQKEVKNEKIV